MASRVKLWRIETGKVVVKVGDVRGLCWLYNANPETTDALSELAIGSRKPSWRQDHHVFRPAGFDFYSNLEAMASDIRSYNPELVHPLLQTDEYAREICREADPQATDEGVRRRLELIGGRRVALRGQDPTRIIAILGAGALSRQVGNRSVMTRQISHLHELNASDNIDIRVLPWDVGAHPAMMVGAFTILDFVGSDDPPVAHTGTLTGARYEERPNELEAYRNVFKKIYSHSIAV